MSALAVELPLFIFTNTRPLFPMSNAREDDRQQPASGEPTVAPKDGRLALTFEPAT